MKFTLFMIVIIVALGVGGYFAYTSMTNPASYVTSSAQTIGDLHQVTSAPDTNDASDATDGDASAAGANATVASTANATAPAATTPSQNSAAASSSNPPATTTTASSSSANSNSTSSSSTATSSSANATLLANLGTLLKSNTLLKVGMQNASVGYVEQFMNLYFQENSAIDNDFGTGLQAKVVTFQKQNKVSDTGQVGPQTLQMMVLWLQNNS